MATKKEETVPLRLHVHPINIVEEVQWIQEGQVIPICPVEVVGLQDQGNYIHTYLNQLFCLTC